MMAGKNIQPSTRPINLQSDELVVGVAAHLALLNDCSHTKDDLMTAFTLMQIILFIF